MDKLLCFVYTFFSSKSRACRTTDEAAWRIELERTSLRAFSMYRWSCQTCPHISRKNKLQMIGLIILIITTHNSREIEETPKRSNRVWAKVCTLWTNGKYTVDGEMEKVFFDTYILAHIIELGGSQYVLVWRAFIFIVKLHTLSINNEDTCKLKKQPTICPQAT